MSNNKRKLDLIESTTEVKHSKIESNIDDFLQLNDVHFTEIDYQLAFKKLADKLINSYELVINEQHFFRLCEIEFYFYHQIRHPDTFAHCHPEQKYHSNWYFHRQGTSSTANYKAGTYKGLDITFNSLDNSSYGGILIRSIENKQTGEIYEGSCLVVDGILNLCNCQTIKEFVDIKLNKNLFIFNKNKFIYLKLINIILKQELISSPRVGLTLKLPSIDREKFLFYSYRFTPKDYYPIKLKITILLSLACEKYFNNNKNKENKFINYAKDLSIQTNTRLSTITNHLNDLQIGYDMDISKKTSPLVDYYKRKLTTSDLAQAYGIWIQKYRSN